MSSSLCGVNRLGRQILNGKEPKTIEEFREWVPLTTYSDYADILLSKQDDMLPDKPVIWIQTTWEGGRNPIKTAPYTKGMLDTYRNNVLACLILSTSREKGKFNVKATDTFLYALAPLPYATGLFPLVLNEEIGIEFLPPVREAVKINFGERNKRGFKLGMRKGIDFFFGLGSVAYYVSISLSALSGNNQNHRIQKSIKDCSNTLLQWFTECFAQNTDAKTEMKPKDLFELKDLCVPVRITTALG